MKNPNPTGLFRGGPESMSWKVQTSHNKRDFDNDVINSKGSEDRFLCDFTNLSIFSSLNLVSLYQD